MSLNRFDYFLPGLPLYDESNIIEIERFTRGSWTETINHIGVTYRDREKDYQVTQASAIDLANAETQGRVVRADMKFPGVTTAPLRLFAEGQGFSLIVTRQRRASEIIKEVLRQINGNLFEDVQGQWVMSLNRFDYFLPGLPLYDESNIIEIERFTRGSWTETINHIGVTYRDREKDYQVTQASAIDLEPREKLSSLRGRASLSSSPGSAAHPRSSKKYCARSTAIFSKTFKVSGLCP